MTNNQLTSPAVKRPRKQQEDRLLKRLSIGDKRKQQRMRQQILSDPLFLVA